MAADFHTHDTTATGRALISTARPLPNKLASLEVHPWSVGADFPGLTKDFSARLAEFAALGEVGYDPLRGDAARQLEVLPELLAIAAELDKPVVLHLVRPPEEVFRVLERYPLRYLVHGFRGKAEKLARYLERGYYVSLGSRALADPDVAEFLQERGLERIGFETDADRGNIGGVLEATAEKLARADVERVTDATFDEFLFGGRI